MKSFWSNIYGLLFAVIGVIFAFSMIQVMWHYYHTLIIVSLFAAAVVAGLVLWARSKRRTVSRSVAAIGAAASMAAAGARAFGEMTGIAPSAAGNRLGIDCSCFVL
mgnify:CR=1 FL=1